MCHTSACCTLQVLRGDFPTRLCGQALEEEGKGRVLVVDGGASMRCALLGDNIAEMAHKNGWSVSGWPPPLFNYSDCLVGRRSPYTKMMML
jgi:hypothetical protein